MTFGAILWKENYVAPILTISQKGDVSKLDTKYKENALMYKWK